MLNIILEMISNGFLFFALHIKNSSSFPPALSSKDEAYYLEKYQNGDQNAKNILIEHNLRLVAHIIKKYYSTYDEQDDLISIGTIGLIKAINTFSPDKNIKLATYASKCIENEILMYFRQSKKNSQCTYLNEPIETDGEGNPLSLIDLISIEDTIADDIDKQIKIKKIYETIEELEDTREKQIIIYRYGLYNTMPLTQKQIAKKLGISRSYVSRIEKKVLEKLKKELE